MPKTTRAREEVAERVNEVGMGCVRTMNDVRNKWRDYSGQTKSSPNTLHRIMALGPSSRRRNQCQWSVELLRSEGKKIATLRGIREELACLREQQERQGPCLPKSNPSCN
ncbi:unnamed protein product [Arctogadus glacialis]